MRTDRLCGLALALALALAVAVAVAVATSLMIKRANVRAKNSDTSSSDSPDANVLEGWRAARASAEGSERVPPRGSPGE